MGSIDDAGTTLYGVYQGLNDNVAVFNRLTDNCKKSFANEILSFVGFAWTLGMAGLDFVLMRQGGPKSSYV